MKETSVDIGKVYALRSETGGEVTDENGKLLETLEPNVQLRTMAQEPKWLVPDDCKVTKGNFKRALAALFLLGEGKNILPAGYTRLEYLESTGTQSINTGLKTTGSLRIGLDVLSTSWGNMDYVFGSENAAGNVAFSMNYYNGYGTAGIYRYGANSSYFQTNAHQLDVRYRYVFDENVVYRNGEVARFLNNFTFTKEEFTSERELKLWACWHPGSGLFKAAGKRVYSFSVFDKAAGKLLLNFIPALDETGAPCMWDSVTRKAFYNAGTGDFVYPTTTTTYSLRRVLPDWGKFTSTGLRRLYHAPANYKGELYDYALENGYKPIVEEPAPEEGCWMSVWHDREDCIELEWVETEPPAEELSTDK